MGKFKFRAFITGCVSCKDTRSTIHKLGPFVVCGPCKLKLERTGSIPIYNGGELKRLLGTNEIFYIPAKKEKVLEDVQQ